MSAKRTATSDLNHTNWDAEEEPEECGVFKTASREELQKRVIRTGRRRLQPGSSTQNKPSVFSGFSGFNKPAPTSFDFLSNLTNGAGTNAANGSTTTKDTAPNLGLFGGSPIANSTTIANASPSSDSGKFTSIFGSQTPISAAPSNFGAPPTSKPASDSKPSLFGTSSSPTTAKQTFGIPAEGSEPKPTMFNMPANNSSLVTSVSKPGFSFGVVSNSTDNSSSSKSNLNNFGSKEAKKNMESVFANKSPSASGFQLPVSSSAAMFNSGSSYENSSKRTKPDIISTETTSDDKKTQYYSKLKGLNESVSEWIRKHVSENALCILTPIFRDYEKYLKELEDEQKSSEKYTADEIKTETKLPTSIGASIFSNKSASSTTDKESSDKPTGLTFGSNVSTPKPFTFGTTTSVSNPMSTTSASPFNTSNAVSTFGSNATSTPFTSTGSTPAPFSFGIGKPFTLNANVVKPPEQNEENKDGDPEDEPPKVEFTPIPEENSVYEKRCKVFIKKDGNFVDKGVGTLYIKSVESNSKYQLIVRANTSLGTVLLNFILSESIPTQRMGKNNVMIVCIPTPEAGPPPVPMLVRVKTSEEADELLETLNKYKK